MEPVKHRYHLCRASQAITLFPNDFISLSTGDAFRNEIGALDPRESSKIVTQFNWPQVQMIKAVDGEI